MAEQQQVEVDFGPFVAKGTRYALDEPFVIDGWKYATDGHAIIAVPTNEPDSESDKPMPPVKELGWKRFEDAQWFTPEPSDLEPLKKECETCHGTGKCVCESCDNSHGCGQCSGTGTLLDENGARRLGGVKVPHRHYEAVMQMPGVEVAVHSETPLKRPVLFRASGGIKGMVMPCRED